MASEASILADSLIRLYVPHMQIDHLIHDKKALLVPLLQTDREKIRSGAVPDSHSELIFGSVASMILKTRPLDLVEVFLRSDPDVFPDFFFGTDPDGNDNSRILKWFSNFVFDGPPKFGSLALEHYAFAHREWFWDQHLHWLSSRAPTPVVAANQRHLMMQLDVVTTVRSLIKPDHSTSGHARFESGFDGVTFWLSSHWRECVRVESNRLLALDPQFWLDRFTKMLLIPIDVASRTQEGASNAYWELVQKFLSSHSATGQLRTLFSGLSEAALVSSLKVLGLQLSDGKVKHSTRLENLFQPCFECLSSFLLTKSEVDLCRLLTFGALFEFSAELIRMVSGGTLEEIQNKADAFWKELDSAARGIDVAAAHLDFASHDAAMALCSGWKYRAIEALLLQIRLIKAIESGQLDEKGAEDLFVREGISCEVVEVTRVKRRKESRKKLKGKEKGKEKKQNRKGKDLDDTTEDRIVSNSEFLGWRLQANTSKRRKQEDGEIDIDGNTRDDVQHQQDGVLLTLADLHQWFHDAYLRQQWLDR